MTTAAIEAEVIESESETALVPSGPGMRMLGGLSLQDPAETQKQLDAYAASRKQFIEWVFSNLAAGVDFMLIHRGRDCRNKNDKSSPRCDCGGKATLCKPGAEKMCGLLQLRPRFKRDLETWEMLGGEKATGLVALLCELIDPSGNVVAEGRGARNASQDSGDPNKTVKMCQKSAQTDAVLRCAGLSEIFTQDMEDEKGKGGDEGGGTSGEQQGQAGRGFGAAPRKSQTDTTAAKLKASTEGETSRKKRESDTPPPPEGSINVAQLRRIYAVVHEAMGVEGIDKEGEREKYDAVEELALKALRIWLKREAKREHLSHTPWAKYDALVENIPQAVAWAVKTHQAV